MDADKDVGKEICSYLLNSNIDMIILASSCDFVHSLLTNEEVSKDKHLVTEIIERTLVLNKILPFLTNQIYSKVQEHYTLIISIVRIINLISKESINSDRSEDEEEIYKKYSRRLDKSDREKLLFKCLEIPNEEIQLAVARCLSTIRMSEIDEREFSHFVRIIQWQKNLSVEKTEEVLSLIFLVLRRFLEWLRSGKVMSTEFSHNFQIAIENSLDIYARNLARDHSAHPDKQEEQISLAINCLAFLKVVSHDRKLRLHLSNDNARFCLSSSLYSEQVFLKDYSLPLDLETTWIGYNVEHLFDCMIGDNSIDPYSMISFRLISRMADVLENKPERPLPRLQSDTAIQELKNDLKDSMKKRITDEIVLWNPSSKIRSLNLPQKNIQTQKQKKTGKMEKARDKRAKPEEKEENKAQEEKEKSKVQKTIDNEHHENFTKQHEYFSIYGIERLLNYLFGINDSQLGNSQQINSFSMLSLIEREILNAVNEKYKSVENISHDVINQVKRFEIEHKVRLERIKKNQRVTQPEKKSFRVELAERMKRIGRHPAEDHYSSYTEFIMEPPDNIHSKMSNEEKRLKNEYKQKINMENSESRIFSH